MEVPGRKLDLSQETASSEDFKYECQQCSEDGRHVPAKKYCQQCLEFLCANCCEFHKKVKTARNHVLLDISKEKTMLSQAMQPIITCSVHAHKVIEFLCPSHNTTVCSVCAVLDHKPCPLKYIPDVSGNYITSKEFKKFSADLDTLLKDASWIASATESNIKMTEEDANCSIENIRTFKKDFDLFLLQKEEELIQKVQKMRHNDIRDIENVKENCEKVNADIKDIQKRIKSVDKNCSDLLITSKQLIAHVRLLQSTVKASKEKGHAWTYYFTENIFCHELISSNSLGTVDKIHSEECSLDKSQLESKTTTAPSVNLPNKRTGIPQAKLSRLPDINVTTTVDKREAWITGITLLLPNSLLLADYDNASVKSFDTTTNAITSCQPLSSSPWDITTLFTNEAVVTLPIEKKLQIMSTLTGLSLVRTVAVSGECRGIDSTMDRIVVSYVSPNKVEILNYAGGVVHTIFQNETGNLLFSAPYYLRVINEKGCQVIYVSNFGSGIITKMLMTGQVLFQYKDIDLSWLYGLDFVDDEHMLVCGYLSNNVKVVSENGKTVRKLQSKNSMYMPTALYFNGKNRLLYLSCGEKDCNQMRVYRIQ